jgi:hypothetical protein
MSLARPPREKPQRKAEHNEEHREKCYEWRFLPQDYFLGKVDLTDNKDYDAPASKGPRKSSGGG